MSAYSERHAFEITVALDREQLTAHNTAASAGGSGIPIPADPSEWDERDLTVAIEDELVLVEIDGYRDESGTPQSRVAADAAARKAAGR